MVCKNRPPRKRTERDPYLTNFQERVLSLLASKRRRALHLAQILGVRERSGYDPAQTMSGLLALQLQQGLWYKDAGRYWRPTEWGINLLVNQLAEKMHKGPT